MSMNKQYYWIISLDNFAGDDHFQDLPAFRWYLERAAYCRHVDSIYPSVTYPAHTTLMTGRWPAQHGVINNTKFQPERLGREDWYWQSKYIQGKTLVDIAHEQKRKVASYLWPVMGGNRKITYNMPEIFANRKWDNQILTSLRNGSKLFQLEAFLKHGSEMDGIRQPALDDFLHHVVLDTFAQKMPEVQFIHYVDLDATRHTYGHSSPEAEAAIRRHDQRLQDIFDLVEQKGLMDQTHFIILGDHSSIDEHTAVYLNVLFKRQNLLHIKKDGTVQDWRVISHTCDGSAYIQVKDPAKIPLVRTLLETFSQKHGNCIETIYSGVEAEEKGAGPCSLMVEAARGYYFLDEADHEELLHQIRPEDIDNMPHITRSTHGYSPLKENYQTFFSMMGPKIRPGEIPGPMKLVDIAPTIARLWDAVLPETEGKAQEAFFNNHRRQV